ncbi:MAG: M15 family metallopeptidase [Candidatus Paceibacterota bacterium]
MIKPIVNYILWLMGIRKILPQKFVNRVVVEENREGLVQVCETARLKISKYYPGIPKLRKEVVRRLATVADSLPNEYLIILAEGFRSLERQKELWNEQYAKIEGENPELSSSEIDRRTRLFVAKPVNGYGGHQTGGAVDVTLGDKNSKELFLGTKMHECSSKTVIDSKGISSEAKNLRAILLEAMRSAGFVNYPGEWWHFSYGDRLWAAYSCFKKCQYGPVRE